MLDAVVARAAGFSAADLSRLNRHMEFAAHQALPVEVVGRYAPSTNWEIGGPIIERERISTIFMGEPQTWFGMIEVQFDAGNNIFGRVEVTGPTPLIAAMRAYVASKFGDEVDLP